MKIDFTKQFTDMEDKPMNEKDGDPTNLFKVCKLALFVGGKDDSLSMEEGEKCWDLRSKLKPEVMDVTAEEVVLMKKRVAVLYSKVPGMLGQASKFLSTEVK